VRSGSFGFSASARLNTALGIAWSKVMGKWRSRLYGYTGLFTLFALWTPMLWFISNARAYYHMETFEILRMHGFNILLFFLLAIATLAAQFGLILIAQDASARKSS
jgi:hypothetical protein